MTEPWMSKFRLMSQRTARFTRAEIHAIEAEAARFERERLAEQVEAIEKTGLAILGGADMVSRAAVLALIDPDRRP